MLLRKRQDRLKPWHFHWITVQGFKALVEKQTLSFDSFHPDLIHLTGINEVEPRLGGNAVAKSTVWDALCWCLYGRTARNSFAGKIVSWGKARDSLTSVEVCFTLRGTSYRIIREQAPNRLTLLIQEQGEWHEQEVEQQELDALLPLTRVEFLYSILMPQKASLFLELEPPQKMKVLSDIFDLQQWDHYSKEANDRSKALLQEEKSYSSEVRSIRQSLASLDGVAELRNANKLWKTKKTDEIKTLKTDLKACKAEARAISSKEEAVLNQITEHKNLLSASKEIDKLSRNLAKEEDRLETARHLEMEYSVQVEHKQKALQKLASIDGVCPRCRQRVTDEHRATEISRYEEELRSLQRALKEAQQQVCSANAACLKAKQALADKKKALEQWSRTLQGLRSQAALLRSQSSDVKNRISRIRSKIEAVQKEASPFLPLIRKQEAEIAALSKRLRGVQTAVRHLREQHRCTSFWIRGFKHVRLLILQDLLEYLELELSHVLPRLGLVGWEVLLSVEKISGAGNIQRGIFIKVSSPSSPKDMHIAIEQWSGGETQRLGLALQLALSNLILGRKGVSTNIQVFDEPTSFLSETGVSDLVDVLATWAQDHRRQVWIVDHRELVSDSIAKRVILRKTKKGATIEV